MGRKSKNQASNMDANNGATEQDDFGDQPSTTNPTSAPTTTVAPTDMCKYHFLMLAILNHKNLCCPLTLFLIFS